MDTSVLIAETDDELSDVLGYYLSERGYWVQTAADGRECLDRLREFQPRTLVIDRDLPWDGDDGLVGYIRQNGDVPSLMLVTGTSSPEELASQTGVPLECCFRKPFCFRGLLERIRSGVTGPA